tara:strand:- start:361 stop:528 length:168 start_codon:yes stop_codon:yes gene_type:complete
MEKQIPRVKLTITQGDIDYIKTGKLISPSVRLEFDEKGPVDLRFCIVDMVWSDEL